MKVSQKKYLGRCNKTTKQVILLYFYAVNLSIFSMNFSSYSFSTPSQSSILCPQKRVQNYKPFFNTTSKK